MSTEAVKCCVKVRFKSSDSLFIRQCEIKYQATMAVFIVVSFYD